MPDKARYIWLFFSLNGRIGRAVYFLAYMLIGVIQLYPIYRAIFELIALGPENLIDRSMDELFRLSPEFERWWSVAGFLTFITLWPCIALAAKRLHDIGRSGLFTIALFIPVVQFFVFIGLCLIPGQAGPNAYGRVVDRKE